MSRVRRAALIGIIVVGAALAGCASTPAHRGYVRMPFIGQLYYRAADHTLHALTCGAEFRMTESARQVTIVFAEYDFPPGVAALGSVGASCRGYDFVLRLRAPLGGRRVVDGVSGMTLPVANLRNAVAPGLETPAPSLPAGG